MPKHRAYLWEAYCIQPDAVIQQDVGGWKLLKQLKYRCVALILKPQQKGFKQISFDFRPNDGFVLQWVGWENSVSFCGSSITEHSATTKIVARQFFELKNEDDGKLYNRWFDFFYYILLDGNVVAGNADFDLMSVKMKDLDRATSNSQL